MPANTRRDRTGDVVWRYRPLVVILVSAGLIVFAAGHAANETEQTTTPARDGGRAAAPGALPTGVDTAGPAVSSDPRAALGATQQDAAAPGAAFADPATNENPNGEGPAYPGIGTEAALANPDCDAERGHVRWPSIYSPACVVPWPEGADNGGDTAQGVSEDSIRIIVYVDPEGTTQMSREDVERVARETVLMRSGVYELWGRELDVRFFDWSGTDEVSQRADAVEIATRLKPFIATSMLTYGGEPRRVWATELAARGVITWDPVVTADEATATPGFRWAFTADDRLHARVVGEYVAKRLWGHPARWAGNPTMHATERVFGLAYDQEWDLESFKTALDRNRPGAAVAEAIAFDPQQSPVQLQDRARVQIARFKDKGVNNVIAVSGLLYTAILTAAATSQDFYPEWTITGWAVQDTAVGGRLADPAQWRNASGIGPLPPFIKPNHLREDLYQYEWVYGRRPEGAGEQAVIGQVNTFARDFLSGVHLAGPNLNFGTLRAALFAMEPRGGRWCDCLTSMGSSYGRNLSAYGDDKYFTLEDFTEKWWDATATGTDEIGITATGVYQHVAGGKRYLPGDFPDGEPPMFNPDGAVTGYEGDVPPQDQYPTYPRREE